MNPKPILAAAILLAATLPADARPGHSTVSCFSGGRYIDCSIAGKAARALAPASHARRDRRSAARTYPGAEKPFKRLLGGAAGMARIVSRATGASAAVAASARDRFQGLLDDLEAQGARVYYMGGWRRGRCSLGSQHPCGLAVDFCQDYRGHVSGARDCHLPGPAAFHALARAHGLYEGSTWCSSDYGHVQVRDSGGCNVAAHGSAGRGGHRRRVKVAGR